MLPARVTESTVGRRPLAVARILIAAVALLKVYLVLPRLIVLEDEPLRLPLLPLPDLPWLLILAVWTTSAVLLLFGIAIPLAGALLTACTTYTLFLDERTYSNNLLLLVLLLAYLTATGGGRIRRPTAHVRAPAVFLMMTQVSTLYAFTGISKIDLSFLSGRVFRNYVGVEYAPISFPMDSFPQYLLVAAAVAVILLELFLSLALWIPRLRVFACIGGVTLHVSIIVFMEGTLNLLCFGLLCLAVYPLFYSWRPAQTKPGAAIE